MQPVRLEVPVVYGKSAAVRPAADDRKDRGDGDVVVRKSKPRWLSCVEYLACLGTALILGSVARVHHAYVLLCMPLDVQRKGPCAHAVNVLVES